MQLLKPFLCSFLLMIEIGVAAQEGSLIINELMQSNIDCLMDSLCEFPDSWVELYNDGNIDVNLDIYKLGTSDNPNEAYLLPSRTVKPKEHVLIYCDKVGDKYHSNFRLESGKNGEVWLFCDDQAVDNVTKLAKQPAPNIAYGRETDGSSVWGYQLVPSPGTANRGQICDASHILGAPQFSELGHCSSSEFSILLELTLPEDTPPGTEIRYTTNGSEPTRSSLLYSAPIPVDSTVIIRARLFCDGWLSPTSTTHSYIHFPRLMTLPVVSIVTDDRYLYDEKIGIIRNNSHNNPNDWRRPINFEYFPVEGGKSLLNQLCETRIYGGISRDCKLKSMALYAHKRFGTKRFEYEFFPDQRPGDTDFKSILLRNAGNDFYQLYMRDAIIQRTMASHVDLDWQAWSPAVIYINGTYKGILNIRERANESNIYTHYDKLEDIDLIENWKNLKEGTWDNFNEFKKFYSEKGHTMVEYEAKMDCSEFMNIMIMNLYFNNLDFPGNNNVMWRPREEGGRWRWFAKDLDVTMGFNTYYDYNILNWLYNPDYDEKMNWGANGENGTILFRRLMEDVDFHRLFIDRCAVYMGDFMNLEGTREVWDPMYERIKAEHPYHLQLFTTWSYYNEEVAFARNWLEKRTNFFYHHLGNYYELGTPIPVTINKSQPIASDLSITFNDIQLSKGGFNGQYYPGRTLTLEDHSEGDTKVYGWRIVTTTDTNITTEEVSGKLLSMIMPQCSSLNIDVITDYDPAGISTLSREESFADIYDLNGRKIQYSRLSRSSGSLSGTMTSLDNLPHGIYVVRGRKVIK